MEYCTKIKDMNKGDEFDWVYNVSRPIKGEFIPVYVALGMIMMSLGFGLHTAMQQLARAPGVYVKKSRRETLPEVVEPDQVVDMADRFIKKSFFRKVAHVQDRSHREDGMPDPIRGEALARCVHALFKLQHENDWLYNLKGIILTLISL